MPNHKIFILFLVSILNAQLLLAQQKNTGTISGYIRGPGKKVSKRAYIMLRPFKGYNSKDYRSVTVDSSGFFIYDNVSPGIYAMSFDSYQSQTLSIDSMMVNNGHIVLDLHLRRQRDFFFNQPVLNLNIHQGWRTMGEICLGLGQHEGGGRMHIETLTSFQAGCQFNFNPNHFIIGPSLSVNASAFILQGGLSIIYFTDFDRRTLYINPHVGLTFNTYFDLYFGYNIPLMRNDMKSMVNGFTVTLAVPLLDRDWIGGGFKRKRYYYDNGKKKLKRKRSY